MKKDVVNHFDQAPYVIANRKYRQRDIYTPEKQDSFDIISAYVLMEIENIIITPTEFKPSEMKKLFQIGYKKGLRWNPMER